MSIRKKQIIFYWPLFKRLRAELLIHRVFAHQYFIRDNVILSHTVVRLNRPNVVCTKLLVSKMPNIWQLWLRAMIRRDAEGLTNLSKSAFFVLSANKTKRELFPTNPNEKTRNNLDKKLNES